MISPAMHATHRNCAIWCETGKKKNVAVVAQFGISFIGEFAILRGKVFLWWDTIVLFTKYWNNLHNGKKMYFLFRLRIF